MLKKKFIYDSRTRKNEIKETQKSLKDNRNLEDQQAKIKSKISKLF